MDIKDIKDIWRFLKSTDIVELDIEDGRGKLRIKRRSVSAETALVPQPPAVEPKAEAPKEKPNIKTITSPMVGTFYRAPSTEAPPFVEIGTHVNAGQAVCIIEAMKIMNEVESEFAGKVVGVLVENGQPVEYGEPLFRIEV
jgi:biotin carboxyl carrier protein